MIGHLIAEETPTVAIIHLHIYVCGQLILLQNLRANEAVSRPLLFEAFLLYEK